MSKLRPTDTTGLGFDKNEFSHTKFGFSDLLMATPNDQAHEHVATVDDNKWNWGDNGQWDSFGKPQCEHKCDNPDPDYCVGATVKEGCICVTCKEGYRGACPCTTCHPVEQYCPNPPQTKCDSGIADECCGGGVDEHGVGVPCDCVPCHPHQVFQKEDPQLNAAVDRMQEDNPHLASNHFKDSSLTPEIKAKIASFGLQRVAGNLFACPSTTDFWQVQGNKIIKLVGAEVDNGDKLAAAPEEHPQDFINSIMADLEF